MTRTTRVVPLLSALAVLLAVAGCNAKGGSEQLRHARPLAADLMEAEALQNHILQTRGAPTLEGTPPEWRTMSATCRIAIASPQLQLSEPLVYGRGKLCVQRPGRIRLAVPTNRPGVRLIGDGQNYRVEMPRFGSGDAYGGAYEASLETQSRRVLFRPDDLINAWDLTALFARGAPVVTHVPGVSFLDLMGFQREPQERLYLISTLQFVHQNQQVLNLQKFDRDGVLKVNMTFANYRAVPAPSGATVHLPTRVFLRYPASQTTIRVELSDVKLGAEIPEGAFELGESPAE